MPTIPFVNIFIRALIWSVTFVFVQIIGKVIFKSIGDMYKMIGILGFSVWLCFSGAMVYTYYQIGDLEYAIYACISVLVIHLILWGMGYFERD